MPFFIKAVVFQIGDLDDHDNPADCAFSPSPGQLNLNPFVTF